MVDWYEKNPVETTIKSPKHDLKNREGRLKTFILAVFYNCIFQEEIALQIFVKMEEHGYLELSQLSNFETNMKDVLSTLQTRTGKSRKVLTMQRILDSVRGLQEIFSQEDDVVALYRTQGSVEDF